MTDILNFLRSYPDDPAAVMSQARVAEVIAEIERLRAELAAALQDAEDLNLEVEHYANLAIVDLGANPTVSWMERAKAAEAERDALRALLKEALDYIDDPYNDLAISIGAALNKGGGDE